MDSASSDKLYIENLYATPLALEEELPRLAAQARLLFAGQSFFVPKIKLPVENGKMLDVGSGPGVHFSLVRKLFPGFSFTGIELAEDLHQYAKMNYPDIDWKIGSVYKIPVEDASYDVAQASFLFIHLREPQKALAEINRVLKPGSIFFVLDVDDSTFKGTSTMTNLVKKHLEIYEADRTIMSKLKPIAESTGFEQIAEDFVYVDNRGKEDSPVIEYPSIHLGKMTFWSMFAFMGQRSEVADVYDIAHRDYMSSAENFCEISVIFQAYRKK